MSNKLTVGVLVVLTLLVAGLYVKPSVGNVFGSSQSTGPAHYQQETFQQGIQIGVTGSPSTFVYNTSNCNLIGGSAGVAATTTANFDCTVSGVKPGDSVLVDPPITAPITPGAGWLAEKGTASTTAGYVTISLLNLTGTASTTLGTNITQGWEVRVVR